MSSPRTSPDFLIIAPLEEEREAILRRLAHVSKLPPFAEDGYVYYEGSLSVSARDDGAQYPIYRIIVTSPLRMGRVEANSVATYALRTFQPKAVLLIGIAGGLAGEVNLGDVVIADQVVDYEVQKITAAGVSPRHRVYEPDRRLFARAQHISGWESEIQAVRPASGAPKRLVGIVASGDKVIARGDAFSDLKRHFPKLMAIEMEAAGVQLAALAVAPPCGVLMIRGISDLADEAKDSANVKEWRSYACDVAAAFAVALLKDGPLPPPRKEVLSPPSSSPPVAAAPASPLTNAPPRSGRLLPFSRNACFVGRDDTLAQIRRALESSGPRASVIALTGMRGVGKTQLAIEYAYRHAEDQKHYERVLWVRADSEELLRSEFASLATLLDIEEKARAEPELRIEGVRRWLTEKSGWLLIIDSADKPESVRWLSALLPLRPAGHVLVTSTHRSWNQLAQSLPVQVLAPQHAIELLAHRSGRPRCRESAAIALRLGQMPLALMQAAAYLERTGMSYGKYLQLLDEREAEVLARPPLDDYPATVATVWSLSFAQLQQDCPAATLVLGLGAYLAPMPFPIGALFRDNVGELPSDLACLQPLVNPLELQDAIASLRNYSLVEVDDDMIWFHPLVQSMARHSLDSKARTEWSGVVTNLIRRCFQYSPHDLKTWSSSELLFPHAWVCLDHALEAGVGAESSLELGGHVAQFCEMQISPQVAGHVFDRLVKTYEPTIRSGSPEHVLLCAIKCELINNLRERDCYREALTLAEHLADEVAALPDGDQVCDLQIRLAVVQGSALLAAGQFQLALEAGRRALSLLDAHPSPALTTLLASANSLVGLALQNLATFPESRRHLELALAALPESDTTGTIQWAVLQHNLGITLTELGDIAGAERAYRLAVERMEMLLGPYHYTTGGLRTNLGMLLMNRGKRKAAEAQLRSAYWAVRRCGHERSEQLSTALRTLAEVYLRPGYWKRARVLAEHAVRIDVKNQVENHPATINSYETLARSLQGDGAINEARIYFEKARTANEQLRGKEHPETAKSYHNMGVFLVEVGDIATGLEYLQRALEIDEKVYGKDHFEVATDLDSVAQVYLLQHNWAEALPRLERSLAIREAQFGSMSERQLQTTRMVAHVLTEQGAWPLSLRYHALVIGHLTKQGQPSRIELIHALREQVYALCESGDHDNAQKQLDLALRIGQELDDAPAELRVALKQQRANLARRMKLDTADAALDDLAAELSASETCDGLEMRAALAHDRGALLAGRKEYAAAVLHYGEAIRLLDKPPERESILLANTLVDMGLAEFHIDQLANAQTHLERALNITLRLRDETHATTGTICRRLGELHRRRHEHRRALDYFARAYKIWERVYGPSHPIVGSLLVDLGMQETEVGDLAAAEEHLAAAQRALTAATNDSDSANIRRHMPAALAWLRIQQGRSEEGMQLIESALAEDQPTAPLEAQLPVIHVLTQLAAGYEAQGKLEEAESNWQRAVSFMEKHLADNELSASLLANLYLKLTMLQRRRQRRSAASASAAHAYRHALRVPVEQREPQQLVMTAVAHANYLRIEQRWNEAKQVLLSAQPALEEEAASDSRLLSQPATSLCMQLGEVLLHLRQESEALLHLERAVSSVENQPEIFQQQAELADVIEDLYANIGCCLLNLNRDPERAVGFLQTEVKLTQARHGGSHFRTAWAMLNLARALSAVRQFGEARSVAKEARQILRHGGPQKLIDEAESLYRQLRDRFDAPSARKPSGRRKR